MTESPAIEDGNAASVCGAVDISKRLFPTYDTDAPPPTILNERFPHNCAAQARYPVARRVPNRQAIAVNGRARLDRRGNRFAAANRRTQRSEHVGICGSSCESLSHHPSPI